VLALLERHPDYPAWVRGGPARAKDAERRLLVALLHASRWPDEIKSKSGYTSGGPANGNVPPPGAAAARNIRYGDRLRHKYWHFVDRPFSSDGTRTHPADAPSLVTEIPLLLAGLNTARSADVRSYDLVWLIHLVGDAHQPLHCVTRFSARQR